MPVPAKRFSFLNQDTNVGVLDFTDIKTNDIFNIPDNAFSNLGSLLSSIQNQLTNVISEKGLLKLIDDTISKLPIGDIRADILSVMKNVFGDLGILKGLLSGLSEACLRDIYGMLTLCDPDFGGSINVGVNPCPTGSIDSLFSSIGVSANSLATSVINYGNGVASSISKCKQNAILAGLISRSSNPEGILEALKNKLDPADIETIRNLIESSTGGGTGPDLFDPTIPTIPIIPIYNNGPPSPVRIAGPFTGIVADSTVYGMTTYNPNLRYNIELIYKDTNVIYKSFAATYSNIRVTWPVSPVKLILKISVTGYSDFITDINVLSIGDTATTRVRGSLIVEPNTTNRYSISGYVIGDVYEITVSRGSVVQEVGMFLYTSPTSPGEVIISLKKTGSSVITKISVKIADGPIR